MKPFKAPPKRFQPKGVSIMYEDHDILVVNKRNGLATVSDAKSGDSTVYFLLTDYVRKGNPKSRKNIFIVHRLDRDTSGLLVFAKNEVAKRYLQDNWSDFKKTYYAVVYGKPEPQEDVIESYLAENSAYKMYSTPDPSKGKLSKTGYRVVRQSKKCSLLEIDLLTGRKNQIRVHLSEKGFPVVGDKRYGDKTKTAKRLGLHACALHFRHPHSHEEMSFRAPIPNYFESLVGKADPARNRDKPVSEEPTSAAE